MKTRKVKLLLKLLLTNFHPLHIDRNAFYFVLFKGWCTTRHAGVRENSRPDATNGWGFCSTDPSQENCNGEIKTKAWLA